MAGLHLNVDCAEDRLPPEQELQLLNYANCLNISCGAHAGDPVYSQRLAAQALAAGVEVALHPGYPDRVSGGRRRLAMSWPQLAASLDAQRRLLPDCSLLKFHGALYNLAAAEPALAAQLAAWCQQAGIKEVVCPPGSCLAAASPARGLRWRSEGFLDRAYETVGGRLQLRSRQLPGALLSEPGAIRQRLLDWQADGCVQVAGRRLPLPVQTWCLHAEGPEVLPVLRGLRQEGA